MQAALHAIEGLSTGLTNLKSDAGLASGGPAPGVQSTEAAQPFSDLLTGAISQVNGLESQARLAVDGLMTGSGVDVHQAMIATEKSEMAFELALAVRNKAVQAYQQVMGMQF
ncbi:MAG TPA: flagellar hook-basal body complex protein FliE [Terracidiphilus sp.]|nr:flagellar hook-basal body complex protein FliE [Terracidiphilus sp.]